MRVPIHPRHLLTSFVLWNTAVNINCLLVVKYEGLYAYGLIMNINIAYQRWFYQWSNYFTILHPNKKHIKWESHWSKLLRYHREIQYVVLKNTTMIATQQPVRISWTKTVTRKYYIQQVLCLLIILFLLFRICLSPISSNSLWPCIYS